MEFIHKTVKKAVQNIIRYLVKINWVWNVIDATLVPLATYAKQQRNAATHKPIVEKAIQSLIPDLTVRNGIFAGMKYPCAEAAGSMVFPKLIGSYEKEIESILQKICNSEYTEIVDIGCAEGYYAVGLAMKLESARIFAYDTDPKALQLCQQMAEFNHVSDRLTTGSFCDSNTLCSLPITKKALIISDCEGYEKILFTQKVANKMATHDFLIEVHDLLDIEISSHLKNIFENTHHIIRYASTDDIQKAVTYDFMELSETDLKTRKILLAENRAGGMEWFFITPKDTTKHAEP